MWFIVFLLFFFFVLPVSALAVKFYIVKRLSSACFSEADHSNYKNVMTTLDRSCFSKQESN